MQEGREGREKKSRISSRRKGGDIREEMYLCLYSKNGGYLRKSRRQNRRSGERYVGRELRQRSERKSIREEGER